MIYDSQLKNLLESLYPDVKLEKFGRKSWYKFPKSNSLLYITGSGERSWYDLDKSNYDFLVNQVEKCYFAVVLVEPSKTFVIPKEKVEEIFHAQPESEYTSKSPGWMFSVLKRNGQHILKFHKGRAEFNIESYLNNWKQISDFENLQPISRSKSEIELPSETYQSVYLTAYPNTNLETSKKLKKLGWKQRPADLTVGDFVFVFDTTKDVIDSCFELKSPSSNIAPVWEDETENKIAYRYRWNAELISDGLGIATETVYTFEPFRGDKKRFSALLRNTTPRSLEEADFSELRLFLLRKCGLPSDRYLLLVSQSDSEWEDKEDEYPFKNTVANYKLVFPGAKAIFFHYTNNKMLFDGYGQISSVNDMGDDGKTKKGIPIIRKVARHNYERFNISESKSSEIEDRIRKLPKFNIQNSIKRIPKSVFDFIVNEQISPSSEHHDQYSGVRKISKNAYDITVNNYAPAKALSFVDLQKFLLDEMQMQANYQPIMIKALLMKGGIASKDYIATTIKESNPDKLDHDFSSIPVYEVLQSHGIVRNDGNNNYILNIETITPQQRYQLIALCNWRINSMPLQLEELIETFNQNKNLFSPNRLSLEKIERIRSVFTSAFPIERISQLQLDEYVVGKPDLKTGVVNKSTFCYRLEHELDKLSGFGVKSALDFGIYYNQKKQKYLYKNEEKYHSAQEAFNAAKFEIFSILQAGKQYHIDHNFDNLLEKLEHDYIIRKNVISKLLSVYYPEAFIRIHSLGQIETVLQSFGKSTDNLDGRLFLAQSQLLEIKKAHPIMRQWNNGDFSHFVWKGIIERKSAISIKSDTGYNIIRNRSQVNDVGETEQQELRPDLHQLQGLKVFDDEELPELTAEDVKKGYQTVSEELLISEEKVTEVITALASGRHVLLAGPIGTGKTRLAQMVSEIFWEKVGGYLAEVHTATADWSTQDVIGGIMPKMENGKVVYEIQNGCAVDTVQKNWQNGIHGGRRIQSKSSAKDTPYRGIWLVIDEFNRADIDKAFGQLFTALRTHCLKIPTDEIDYSYRNLKIPEDYRIIGTLNTADKHFLFVLSDALKSRFAYIEMDIPSKQEYDKEIYYAMKNAISELGLNSNALVSLDSQSKKIVRGTLNQEFYERAYQAYYFLDSIRLFKKLGTAILQLIYQNMLVATRITGNPKMALDNSLTSTLLPQLEGLPQSEIGCIAALHSDSLVQFFRSAYKNPNRQSYAKAFIKALQYLQVPNGARLHSEFINGSLNAEDNNTWIPIQKAYDVTKNNFELNLNRVKYAIDDLKESAVF